MVYEHLSIYFIPQDPSSNFLKLLEATNVIARGDILRSMALMLGANKLLAVAKDIEGLCFVVVGKVFL
jgi:hypothetical protein